MRTVYLTFNTHCGTGSPKPAPAIAPKVITSTTYLTKRDQDNGHGYLESASIVISPASIIILLFFFSFLFFSSPSLGHICGHMTHRSRRQITCSKQGLKGRNAPQQLAGRSISSDANTYYMRLACFDNSWPPGLSPGLPQCLSTLRRPVNMQSPSSGLSGPRCMGDVLRLCCSRV